MNLDEPLSIVPHYNESEKQGCSRVGSPLRREMFKVSAISQVQEDEDIEMDGDTLVIIASESQSSLMGVNHP